MRCGERRQRQPPQRCGYGGSHGCPGVSVVTEPRTPTPAAPPAAIEFRGADGTTIDPADWERRAAEVRRELAADGLTDVDIDGPLATFRFADAAGRAWAYNGAQWFGGDGANWVAGTPATPLRLLSFAIDIVPNPGPESGLPQPASEAHVATHITPPPRLSAWPAPDPGSAHPVMVGGTQPLEVLEWLPTGWARV